MPEAARIDDDHICPMMGPGDVPHQGGKVLQTGARTVFIGGPPAARVGDKVKCNGPPGTIVKGSATVHIEEAPAARRTDPTDHGGTVTVGCGTVTIGDSPPGPIVLLRSGAPLLEICEKPAAAVKV
jgi:uncharacterized Zn-binding protein involved in type VI secretion